MKKIAIVFMMFALALAAVSCGGSKNMKNEMKKEGVNQAVKMASTKDAASALVGEWEAEEIGSVLAQYGFSTPAKFVFKADGSYSWSFTKGGTQFIGTGTFKVLDTTNKPYKIDFFQEKAGKVGAALKASKMVSAGIFEITADGKLKAIFYNKKFLPRAEEFGDDDTQIYKKVK